MTTTSKSDSKRFSNNAASPTISGRALSSWSRQQKLAMLVSFALLGMLLAVSACSKQSPKPALVSVEAPVALSATPAVAALPLTSATVADLPKKKNHRKRPANVTYSDTNFGVLFLYPRNAVLTSGNQEEPEFAGVGPVPMNFVQPGGVPVATVALPANSYPGTDFASAFFNVSVNRSVSEEECAHFAFVDTRNADGEPIDAEKVKVGAIDMELTSTFSASAAKQAETEYYHSYENGECYEYVLGLGTEGLADGGIEHVHRDRVFAKLEKILASVKTSPVEQKLGTEQAANSMTAGK